MRLGVLDGGRHFCRDQDRYRVASHRRGRLCDVNRKYIASTATSDRAGEIGCREIHRVYGIATGDGKSREDGIGIFAANALDHMQIARAVNDRIVRIAAGAAQGNGFTFEFDGFEIRPRLHHDLITIVGIGNRPLNRGKIPRHIDCRRLQGRDQDAG